MNNRPNPKNRNHNNQKNQNNHHPNKPPSHPLYAQYTHHQNTHNTHYPQNDNQAKHSPIVLTYLCLLVGLALFFKFFRPEIFTPVTLKIMQVSAALPLLWTAFKLSIDCPNCHQPIKLDKLAKKPFQGKLKSYQFTPKPSLHCPYCDQKLTIIFNPLYLIIIFLVLVLGIFGAILLSYMYPNLITKVNSQLLNLIFMSIVFYTLDLQLKSMRYEKLDSV